MRAIYDMVDKRGATLQGSPAAAEGMRKAVALLLSQAVLSAERIRFTAAVGPLS